MPDVILNSVRLEGVELTDNGDGLLIGPNGILSVDSAAVVASNINILVDNAGIIRSAGAGFVLLAEALPGIEAARVVNRGSVSGSFGVSADAGTLLDLLNAGAIGGDGGYGVLIGGAGSLRNTGTISGSTGVWIGDTALTLFLNEGTITGNAVGVHSTGGAIGGLVNTGTIAAPVAIETGIGPAVIHNLGLISGAVQLGRFADLYDGAQGTTLGQVLGFAADDTLTGGVGDDQFLGGQGADLLRGNGGDDSLLGESEDDVIRGGEGDDTLRGGSGADELDGGAGTGDLLDYAGSASVIVNLGTGEAIGGDAQGDEISGFEALAGGDGADLLTGDDGANTLRGGAGNDVLVGGAGSDRLLGDTGRDVLVGGLGADLLRGGAAADRFRYLAAEESGPLAAGRDRIRDFGIAERDIIDLSAIDADTTQPGDQAFSLIAGAVFTAPGQLRVSQSAGDTFVFANLDASLSTDFSIRLDGLLALVAVSFDL